MQDPEKQYLDLIKDILENGTTKKLFFTPEVLQQYRDKNQEPPSYDQFLADKFVLTCLKASRY